MPLSIGVFWRVNGEGVVMKSEKSLVVVGRWWGLTVDDDALRVDLLVAEASELHFSTITPSRLVFRPLHLEVDSGVNQAEFKIGSSPWCLAPMLGRMTVADPLTATLVRSGDGMG